MKIIVMGCGRVGSAVSLLFARLGHEVTVIDHEDANALVRLGADFKGRLIHGVGFDRDTLIEAGIKSAEAFVSASASDNANIVAARTARTIFHVPRVIARLYDPLRAEIYQRLGLSTISTTTWGAEKIVEVITHNELDVIHLFRDNGATLIRVEVPTRFNGYKVMQMNIPGEVMVIAITRSEQTFVPVSGTEFQEGDTAYLTAIPSAMPRLEELLGN